MSFEQGEGTTRNTVPMTIWPRGLNVTAMEIIRMVEAAYVNDTVIENLKIREYPMDLGS